MLFCKRPALLIAFVFNFTLLHAQSGEQWLKFFDATENRFEGQSLFWDSLKKQFPKLIASVIESARERYPKDPRATILAARFAADHSTYLGKDWKQWGREAIQLAGRVDDPERSYETFSFMGRSYYEATQYDTCLFYFLKSIELAKKAGYSDSTLRAAYIFVSHPLYHTRNYRECILYSDLALRYEQVLDDWSVIACLNNAGISHQKLGQYDSAIYYHQRAVDFCGRKNDKLWWSISTGNIGDALYAKGLEEQALPYWQTDYDSSMKYGETLNAMMSMACISRYRFEQGEQVASLRQLQDAFQYSKGRSSTNVINISKMLGHCFSRLGRKDSADYYNGIYHRITDSIDKTIYRSNYNYVNLRLEHEKSEQEMLALRTDKETEVRRRNILVVSLVVLSLLGVLLYNRQRLRTKLVQQQRAMAQAEAESAKKELALFTQLLLEKNEQIELLNSSLQQQNNQLNEDLVHKTLLTDHDWKLFRDLFEKSQPHFFERLTAAAPGITTAETRLAALIKLNLDNKQMASMQGISLSGLRATKTRLRQKLNIPAEEDLEKLIKSL
jgi:tetratricopeptide (TPR) repeat protein